MNGRVVLLLSLLLLTPVAVQAQGKKKTARAKFKAGQRYFKQQEYKPALKAFKKAHKLHPHPDILFMVAQCHRNLKQHKQAVKAYKGYLKGKPKAKDRAEVQRLIDELEFLVEVAPDNDPDPPDEPAEPDEADLADGPDAGAGSVGTRPNSPKPGPLARPIVPLVPRSPSPRRRSKPVYKKWWFWAIVGGTVAVAGGVTAVIAYETSGTEVPSGSLGTMDLR